MKKTIQRVLAAVILLVMILSGGFSEVGKVHAEKQQGTTKRAIYVVFDNSGSMYVWGRQQSMVSGDLCDGSFCRNDEL